MNCPNIGAAYGYFNLSKALIDKHNFDVHVNDDIELTVLHSAKTGSYELAKFFADIGNNVYCTGRDG